jgi:hypothetical protein
MAVSIRPYLHLTNWGVRFRKVKCQISLTTWYKPAKTFLKKLLNTKTIPQAFLNNNNINCIVFQ